MNFKQFGSVALMSVLIVSVSAVLTFVRDQVFAQPGYEVNHSNQVVTVPVEPQPPKWLANFTTLEQQGVQLVTIVNPESKRIGVYSVSLRDGSVKLLDMRHLDADFQLRVYNGVGPTPQYIEQNFQ